VVFFSNERGGQHILWETWRKFLLTLLIIAIILSRHIHITNYCRYDWNKNPTNALLFCQCNLQVTNKNILYIAINIGNGPINNKLSFFSVVYISQYLETNCFNQIMHNFLLSATPHQTHQNGHGHYYSNPIIITIKTKLYYYGQNEVTTVHETIECKRIWNTLAGCKYHQNFIIKSFCQMHFW
jgi:hypothetical protein